MTQRKLFVLMLLPMLIPVLAANAYQTGNFDHLVPSLEGYVATGIEGYDDIDEDGTKETYVRSFKNAAGDKIYKYTKGKDGEVWAWGKVHHNEDPNDTANNYAIIRSTSNGPYDRMIRIDEDFIVPDWVK